MQEREILSLGQEEPLEKEKAIHSSILARTTHGQRSLAGKESDTTVRPRYRHCYFVMPEVWETVTGPQAGHRLVPFFSQYPRAAPVAPRFQLGKKPGKVPAFAAAAPHTAWKNPRCQRAVDVRRCGFL